MNETASRFENWVMGLKKPLMVLLAIGLAIRFVLAPTLTFNVDMGYWTEAVGVFRNGFGLYGTAGYYYTPIWGYMMGVVSSVSQIIGLTDYGVYVPGLEHVVNETFKVSAFVTTIGFNTLVKIPLIIIDVAVAVLLYRFVMKHTGDEKKAVLAFALWMFSPLVIVQSSIHGMFDNTSAMLILLTVMFLFDRKYLIAGFAFGLAAFTKYFPLFFIFFLVAYVLKREGVDANGAKKLLISIAGTFAAILLLYFPNITRGDFWQSFYFLAYRVGISRETLASIGMTETVVILGGLAAVILLFVFLIARFGPRFMKRMCSGDVKRRKRKVAMGLFVIALALIIPLAIIWIFEYYNDVEALGMRGVVLITIFAICLEIYLAFRMLMEKELDQRKTLTYLFLTALSVIMWSCAPSYYVVILPFIILYCTMVDRRYILPYFFICFALTLQELPTFLTSPTSLIMALCGNIDVMIPVYDFLALPVAFGQPGYMLLSFVTIIGYGSILYISLKWYHEYYLRKVKQ